MPQWAPPGGLTAPPYSGYQEEIDLLLRQEAGWRTHTGHLEQHPRSQREAASQGKGRAFVDLFLASQRDYEGSPPLAGSRDGRTGLGRATHQHTSDSSPSSSWSPVRGRRSRRRLSDDKRPRQRSLRRSPVLPLMAWTAEESQGPGGWRCNAPNRSWSPRGGPETHGRRSWDGNRCADHHQASLEDGRRTRTH